MSSRPKIIVVNRGSPAKRSKIDIAVISLDFQLQHHRSRLLGVFNYADTRQHYVQQTQAQWQQKLVHLSGSLQQRDSAGRERRSCQERSGCPSKFASPTNRDRLKEGRDRQFSQSPRY